MKKYKTEDYLTARDRAAVTYAILHGLADIQPGAAICCQSPRIIYRFTRATNPGARGEFACDRLDMSGEAYRFYINL